MGEELKIVVYCNYPKHQNHSSLTSIEGHNVPGETLPSLTPDFDLTETNAKPTYDQVAD
jgi:hypothetical protein